MPVKFALELGIDLGTANFLAYRRDKGLVLNEPSVVAVNTTTGKVLKVGSDAYEMLGRTPNNISAIRPLKDGVIANYSMTLKVLEYIFDRSCGMRRMFRPTTMICVPSSATNVERRAVLQAAREAGAGIAMTIEEPMAAAIGAGLPVISPGGNMVVDVGGGTTDIAIISLGGIVLSTSVRVGGNKLDDAIVRHIRNVYNLAIGETTAEEIKIKIGSVWPMAQEMRMEVRGRDLVAGLPSAVEITSDEIRDALTEPILQVAERLCWTLEQTPPELAADIIDRGVTLTGGGAMLRGLDKLLHSKTDIAVRVADNALTCVAIGTGRALEELEFIQNSGAVTTI
ncbi:MAG TPA: rod shape-determining protein [Fimbriimonadaceae bacterium]|nr:rod shape-determining protein [Fimbriimonadaceae bacterium]